MSLSLDPRERLGVVGANGSGKSTLLEVLAGRLTPTAGRVEQGPTVRVGYYAQYGPRARPGRPGARSGGRTDPDAGRPRRSASHGALLVQRGVALGDGRDPIGR